MQKDKMGGKIVKIAGMVFAMIGSIHLLVGLILGGVMFLIGICTHGSYDLLVGGFLFIIAYLVLTEKSRRV